MNHLESTQKIQLLGLERQYDGFFKIDKLRFKHTLFQGGWTPEIERELFGRGEAVVVLLYDLAEEVVVLVEQCRAGALNRAGAQNYQAWLLEPVAGMIDAGETPLDACVREAKEEAGAEIEAFEYICQFYPSPGGSDEILHLYAAQVDSTQLPEYAGLAEEAEDIHLVRLSFEKAQEMLLKAEFNVASTLISIQWLLFQKLNQE